jgi:hypothetical protein
MFCRSSTPYARKGCSASRLRQLSWVERAVLAEAVVCLAIARAAVRVLPFGMIAPRLGQRMTESPADAPSTRAARRVAWAIGAAARRTPWRSKCLEQGIAGKMMLRRRRVPSTLYLGVARPLETHAWLRVGTDTVLGGHDLDRYAVVAAFGDPGRA